MFPPGWIGRPDPHPGEETREVDDAANFESCQEGLESMPEIEWVDISRHMSDTEGAGYDNVLTNKPTSEIHSRSYFDTWKRLMNVEPDSENLEV